MFEEPANVADYCPALVAAERRKLSRKEPTRVFLIDDRNGPLPAFQLAKNHLTDREAMKAFIGRLRTLKRFTVKESPPEAVDA